MEDKLDVSRRQQWMSVLARASAASLQLALDRFGHVAEIMPLRAAETGLVMVRGRAGGSGQRFNVGEMTVTRAAVNVGGRQGHGYVRGRDKRHAELAAIFDAMLQDEQHHDELMRAVIEPLAAEQTGRRQKIECRAAATKVDFFTMVRGDG